MTKRWTWMVLIAAGAASGLGHAKAHGKQAPKTIVEKGLGEQAQAAADRVNGFWGSVLVAKGGDVVFAKGYGNADFQDTPCTPSTLFELASVSKQVTATAVLHLAQKGKLSLDDPLGAFFKKVPDDKQAITVHHLLTHTAGLHDEGVSYSDPIGTSAYVKAMLAKPAQSPPGSVHRYSNVGYALLGCIVELVGKTSFEKYCEKHLFKPAKMKNTGFIGDKDLIKSAHVSRRKDGTQFDRTAADWNWGWGYRGMGGVVTNVLDMHLWDRALRDDTILDARHRALLYEPRLQGYACGWNVAMTDRGTLRVSHSGGVKGYNTNLIRYVEDDAMIVVLGNDGRATFEVSGAMDRLLFERAELEATLDVGGIDDGAPLSSKAKFSASVKKDSLTLRLRDGKKTPLELTAPAGVARRLLFQLEQAVRDRARFDDGKKASVQATVDARRYDQSVKKHTLTKNVRLVGADITRRDARGKEIIGATIRISVYDFEHGGRPVTADLNVAAAKELIEDLRGALK